jgi:SAM-dependent methyltransferase
MRDGLLRHLRCPDCGETLDRQGGDALVCRAGTHTFPVIDGVPRFTGDSTATAKYFGHMWGEQATKVAPLTAPTAYHLHAMRQALDAPPFAGLILDAGCGEGIDLATVALDPACEAIGVELSAGGVATTLARTRNLPRAYVVQGNLLRVPLAPETFDGAYSYGVVHHTPDPPRAIREIARTLKPGAPLLYYVYEDFSDRQWYWRLALTLANSLRLVTTRMRPPTLMRVCRALSPVVYVLLTVPARHFSWAKRFPYRHGTTPGSMSGDLYDRLSAPIEKRYSAAGAAALASDAGLDVIRVAQQRGWMVYARKRPLKAESREPRADAPAR